MLAPGASRRDDDFWMKMHHFSPFLISPYAPGASMRDDHFWMKVRRFSRKILSPEDFDKRHKGHKGHVTRDRNEHGVL